MPYSEDEEQHPPLAPAAVTASAGEAAAGAVSMPPAAPIKPSLKAMLATKASAMDGHGLGALRRLSQPKQPAATTA